MARKSRIVQILTVAEDLLISYHKYFEKKSLVYRDTGLPKEKTQKSVWYLVNKNILNKNLSFNKKPKSVFREIAKPWDKKWRIIIYDIPEENSNVRDNLTYLLRDLGYQRLQRSVWLSPLTKQWILEKIKNLIKNPKFIFTFKAELSRSDSNYIVDELWPVDDWKYDAKNFLNEINKKSKLTKKDQESFWNLIAEHPKIPLDLLPRNWPLKTLAQKFATLSK